MPERSYNGSNYLYGYQGQEILSEIFGELNCIEYLFRIEDSRLGRFLSIDPLYMSYPWNSPYSFAENRVIQFIELEGAQTITPEIIRMPRIVWPELSIPKMPTCPIPPPPIMFPPTPRIPTIPQSPAGPLNPSYPNGISIPQGEKIDVSPEMIRTPDFDYIPNWRRQDNMDGNYEYDQPQPGEKKWDGGYKTKKSQQEMKKSKEADDAPEWARGYYKPRNGESGEEFAGRLLDRKYGKGNWKKGSDTEFSKLKKYGERCFKDVIYLPIQDYDILYRNILDYNRKIDKYRNDLEKYNDDLKEYNKKLDEYFKEHPEVIS